MNQKAMNDKLLEFAGFRYVLIKDIVASYRPQNSLL